MSQSLSSLSRPYIAGADLSSATASKYHIMKVSAANTVVISSAATDLLVGVLVNQPKSGMGADIVVAGTVQVYAGGTINLGDDVTADSAGAAVATTTTGNVVIGRANIEAAASGDIIEIQVCTPYLHK